MQFILLNTKNIQQITIENVNSNCTTIIDCEKKILKVEASNLFESIQDMECKINTKTFKRDESKEETFIFHSYLSQLTLPEHFVLEEKLNTNKTFLSITFPLELDKEKTYPVCAFAPVYNQGFRFLINAYWALTSNRESNNFYLLFCLLDRAIYILRLVRESKYALLF